MSALVKTLVGHIPALIARRFATNPSLIIEPNIHPYSSAILDVDISVLTTLTANLREYGVVGSEELIHLLKTKFEQVATIITDHGGDIVKFTSDSLLVLWLEDALSETRSTISLRAVQCALELRDRLHNQPLTADLPPFTLKIGLGLGEALTTDVGGVYGRWEFLVTGNTVAQTKRAQHEAASGDIVITPEAWSQLQDICSGQTLATGHTRLTAINTSLPAQPLTLPALPPQAEAGLRGYVPGAFLARLSSIQTSLFAEILPVTVLVINLPDLTDIRPIEETHTVIRLLQTTLYDYEGSVVRINVDHGGTLFVAALGLPPVAHDNDATLAVQTALAMKAQLQHQSIRGAIGVTTGPAFCGLVGNEQRHEYTIVGQDVKVAEQLMSLAQQQSEVNAADSVTIFCDSETYELTQNQITFKAHPDLSIPEQPFSIYEPIANLVTAEEPPLPDMDRWMAEIYERFRAED